MVKKKVSKKKGIDNKNLVVGVVVILLLIGVFWYFNNQGVYFWPGEGGMRDMDGDDGMGDMDGDQETKKPKRKQKKLKEPQAPVEPIEQVFYYLTTDGFDPEVSGCGFLFEDKETCTNFIKNPKEFAYKNEFVEKCSQVIELGTVEVGPNFDEPRLMQVSEEPKTYGLEGVERTEFEPILKNICTKFTENEIYKRIGTENVDCRVHCNKEYKEIIGCVEEVVDIVDVKTCLGFPSARCDCNPPPPQ